MPEIKIQRESPAYNTALLTSVLATTATGKDTFSLLSSYNGFFDGLYGTAGTKIRVATEFLGRCIRNNIQDYEIIHKHIKNGRGTGVKKYKYEYER
jgi:hypothetical protein